MKAKKGKNNKGTKGKVKDLVQAYLASTSEFSAMLNERTPDEITYDNAVIAGLRKGLPIKAALKAAGGLLPGEAL